MSTDSLIGFGLGGDETLFFVDGNKRIGFAIAVHFLELNGKRFAASEVDAVLKTLALAAGEMDETALAAWLMDNIE